MLNDGKAKLKCLDFETMKKLETKICPNQYFCLKQVMYETCNPVLINKAVVILNICGVVVRVRYVKSIPVLVKYTLKSLKKYLEHT